MSRFSACTDSKTHENGEKTHDVSSTDINSHLQPIEEERCESKISNRLLSRLTLLEKIDDFLADL